MKRWNPNSYLREGTSKGFGKPYLDALVSAGREIQSSQIPVVFTLSHLANLSRTLYLDLHTFVSRPTPVNGYPYKNFTIRKRKGGHRWISIPVPPLMAVQSWIAHNILSEIAPHSAAGAYYKDCSPKRHAENLCDADWILKIDISNFFDNITEFQVYKVFKAQNYPDLLAFEMARLCTKISPFRKAKRWKVKRKPYDIAEYYCRHVGSLPQGAPTSPALSNLVCFEMDKQIEKLALENGTTYSRYSDDLCFSLNNSNREGVFEFKKKIVNILWENGFSENKKKARIIPPGARKMVTGLVVNGKKPTVPKEMRDEIKMHLYYCKKCSIPDHCNRRGFRSVIGFRNHLHGLIMYVNSINADQGKKYLDSFSALPWVDFDI